MKAQDFSFEASLEHIDEPGGWWYVRLPDEIKQNLKPFMSRGSVKVNATVGKSTWKTAVMPIGNGVSMVAIKAEIRIAENLEIGQIVGISLKPVNL